jgi:hypothetical protein
MQSRNIFWQNKCIKIPERDLIFSSYFELLLQNVNSITPHPQEVNYIRVILPLGVESSLNYVLKKSRIPKKIQILRFML